MEKLSKKQLAQKKEVRDDLIHQLILKGADTPAFIDLIDKYMELWDVFEHLSRDIAERGVMYEDYSSIGVKMMKNNPSVKDRAIVLQRMQDVLRQLKITTDMEAGECADDKL